MLIKSHINPLIHVIIFNMLKIHPFFFLTHIKIKNHGILFYSLSSWTEIEPSHRATELRSRAKTFKIRASEPLSWDQVIETWFDQAKSRLVIKQRSKPRSKLFGLCSHLSLFEAKLKPSSSYTLSLRGNVEDNSMNQGIHVWFNEHESKSYKSRKHVSLIYAWICLIHCVAYIKVISFYCNHIEIITIFLQYCSINIIIM